jgi:uncharacterized membrane protein
MRARADFVVLPQELRGESHPFAVPAMKPPVPHRSWTERVLHATAFELIATLICAPALAFAMGQPMLQMGALTITISLIAMAWNMVFNAGFDRLQRRHGFVKTPRVRIVHALAFEFGLAAVAVPLTAWWLDITLWAALVLDFAILLFFLPYTFAFNWVYDVLRERWRRPAQPL